MAIGPGPCAGNSLPLPPCRIPSTGGDSVSPVILISSAVDEDKDLRDHSCGNADRRPGSSYFGEGDGAMGRVHRAQRWSGTAGTVAWPPRIPGHRLVRSRGRFHDSCVAPVVRTDGTTGVLAFQQAAHSRPMVDSDEMVTVLSVSHFNWTLANGMLKT